MGDEKAFTRRGNVHRVAGRTCAVLVCLKRCSLPGTRRTRQQARPTAARTAHRAGLQPWQVPRSQVAAPARCGSVHLQAAAGHDADARRCQLLLEFMVAVRKEGGTQELMMLQQAKIAGAAGARATSLGPSKRQRLAPCTASTRVMPLCSHTQAGLRARMSSRCCKAAREYEGGDVSRDGGVETAQHAPASSHMQPPPPAATPTAAPASTINPEPQRFGLACA